MKTEQTVYQWVKASDEPKEDAFYYTNLGLLYWQGVIKCFVIHEHSLIPIDNVVEYLQPIKAVVLTVDDWDNQQKIITRLKELLPYHINPYNLGEEGEISKLISQLK